MITLEKSSCVEVPNSVLKVSTYLVKNELTDKCIGFVTLVTENGKLSYEFNDKLHKNYNRVDIGIFKEVYRGKPETVAIRAYTSLLNVFNP